MCNAYASGLPVGPVRRTGRMRNMHFVNRLALSPRALCPSQGHRLPHRPRPISLAPGAHSAHAPDAKASKFRRRVPKSPAIGPPNSAPPVVGLFIFEGNPSPRIRESANLPDSQSLWHPILPKISPFMVITLQLYFLFCSNIYKYKLFICHIYVSY